VVFVVFHSRGGKCDLFFTYSSCVVYDKKLTALFMESFDNVPKLNRDFSTYIVLNWPSVKLSLVENTSL